MSGSSSPETPGSDGEPHEEDRAAPVGKHVAAGVFWLTAQKWVTRLTGLATIAILTRLLSPEDFGLVAAASSVLPFFYLLSDLGFAAYIVQAETASRRMLSTGFWFSTVAGFGLFGLLVLAAPLFGLAFRDDVVVPVIQVLSVAVVLTAVGSVPTALLRRSMRFRSLASQGAVSAFVAQVIAVVMTLGGLGVWALVAQALTAQFLMTVLAWFAAKWWPAFAFSRIELSAMMRFGAQVLGVEFVAICRTWAETAIISSTLGMAALGYLNIAQRLVSIVQDLTGAAVIPVSTVAFARIRDAADRLRAAYSRALRMTYATLTPPLTLVAVAAPLIIPILFGKGWDESDVVAQILAIAGIMVVGATLDQGLFYGLGKPGRWFGYAVAIDALTVAMTFLTVRWGLPAVAAGFLLVAAIATTARCFLVARLLGARVAEVASQFGFLAVAVVAAGVAGYATRWASGALPPIVQIVFVGIAVLLVHLVVVRFLAKATFDEASGYFLRVVRSRTSRGGRKDSE